MKTPAHTRPLACPAALLLVFVVSAPAPARAAPKITPVVRVEGQEAPLAVDAAAPVFTWSLPPAVQQTAFQVFVASGGRPQATPDVWDSGKMTGAAAEVRYAGPPLAPHTRYTVQVQVWQGEDRVHVSRPTSFETAFLSRGAAAWKAHWMGLRPAGDDERQPFVGARWLGVPKAAQSKDAERAIFSKRFAIAGAAALVAAELHVAGPAVAAASSYRITINDTTLPPFAAGLWQPHKTTLLPHLREGDNQLWIEAPYAAVADDGALIATVRLETGDGRVRFVPSDRSFRVRTVGREGSPATGLAKQGGQAGEVINDDWRKQDLEKAPYLPSAERGAFGEPIFPRDPGYLGLDRLVPVAYLRKTFAVSRPVARARLHATALGLYECHLNGVRVGDEVLAPGPPRKDKHLGYRSYDVTQQIRHGTNVVGALLADGWPNPAGQAGAAGFTRALRAELHVRYHDGSSEVIATDPSWRGTTGAIRSTSLVGGENIDARRELPGWSMATFDDRTWRGVFTPPVSGELTFAAALPWRRTGGPVRAKVVTSPKPGVQVFDLGRTLSGWVRFRFRAPRGTRVTFHYGEALGPSGQVGEAEGENPSATDTYVAAGRLQEVFEPKFTLHKFRYVQVAGHPVPMSATSLVGVELVQEVAHGE